MGSLEYPTSILRVTPSLSQTTQLVPTQTNLAQGNSFTTTQRLTEEEEFGIIAQGTVNWADRSYCHSRNPLGQIKFKWRSQQVFRIPQSVRWR